jgi:hypothetical protein
MTGMLKAKVGGVWVPVGTQGPAGPTGPIGPTGPTGPVPTKAKARGFNSSLGGGALPAGTVWGLDIVTITLNDGFTKNTSVSVQTIAAGRYFVAACLTIAGGSSGNWVTFGIQQKNSAGTMLANYEIVGQNTSTGYRMFSNAVTVDAAAGDYFVVTANVDAGTPSVDGRSWLSISEVAW